MKRRVTILGSTGSVGCSTLDLIDRNRAAYEVVALTAHVNVERLIEQALRFRPRIAVIADERHYEVLKAALAGTGVQAQAGEAALIEAAQSADWVMASIVGAAGLAPTLAAVRSGAVVALANKEALVCAGELFMAEVAQNGATLLPADSEHNAIFQVLDQSRPEAIEKIILTASGGPFRTFSVEQMRHVSPRQAMNHPVWAMGAKISVDSANLMNKGLEVIEARRLFPVQNHQIEVLVHPQSVIHSMVTYVDGSVLAQLGTPDMRIPISYCLAWPDRIPTPSARLDLAKIGQLTFESADRARFPALDLIDRALEQGGSAPTVLNAANEVAVAAFINGEIGFLDIVRIVEQTLDGLAVQALPSLEDVFAADAEARRHALALIARHQSRIQSLSPGTA